MTNTDEQDSERVALVEARLDALQTMAGHRLRTEDLDLMRQRIARMTKLGADLRVVPLENGDTPGLTFVPFRAGNIS